MSAFNIEDMYDLANHIEVKRQAALEQAERFGEQWEIVRARISRLEEQARDMPDPDDPNDERNYPAAEYDERMMPLENPYTEDGSYDDTECDDD